MSSRPPWGGPVRLKKHRSDRILVTAMRTMADVEAHAEHIRQLPFRHAGIGLRLHFNDKSPGWLSSSRRN